MRARIEYHLMLANWVDRAAHNAIADYTVRQPSRSDAPLLADALLDAYRETIDSNGTETLAAAAEEVDAYFAGERGGPPWPHCSWLCMQQESVIAACLTSFWDARELPLIAYVMTRSGFKGRGIANALLQQSLRSLAQEGHAEVRAVITAGNIPSERLFTRTGFER